MRNSKKRRTLTKPPKKAILATKSTLWKSSNKKLFVIGGLCMRASNLPAILVLSCLFTLLPVLSAIAVVHEVPSPSSSIQAAIDTANAGDTVLVGTGTYYENLTIDREIVVRSQSGAASTIINGSSGTACATFTNNVGNNCVLQEFTLNASTYGAECNNGRPLIRDCIFDQFTSWKINRAHPQEVGYYASNNTLILNYSGQYNAINIRAGTISESTNWPALPAGFVYYLGSNVNTAIEIGGSGNPLLTIEPGAIIKFLYSTGTYRWFMVGWNNPGRLNATGAIFTSGRDDDYGGDSDGNGNSDGAPGDWASILIGSYSGGSILDSCTILYGGTRRFSIDRGAVFVRADSVVINNCTFDQNQTGPEVDNVNPAISDNLITGSTSFGMVLDIPDLDHRIYGNSITNSQYFPVALDPMAVKHFHDNNSVDPSLSGCYNAYYIQDGNITESTTWPALPAGFVYYLGSNVNTSIEVGGSANPLLLIESGAIIKFLYSTSTYRWFMVGWNSPGRLNATGVVFTSSRDDSYGGDTNCDGYSDGAPGDWANILFGSYSGGSIMDGCTIRYGGTRRFNTDRGAVHIAADAVTITNCIFERNEYGLQDRKSVV